MNNTIRILHRYTNAVLYEGASGMTMRETLEAATQTGANLAGANLAGAKWRDGVVINRVPLQLYGLRWPVTLLDAHIQIGCQFHTIAEWREFDDAQIAAMDGRYALRFWRENKAAIMALAATRESV